MSDGKPDVPARIDHRHECDHPATVSARRACRANRLGAPSGPGRRGRSKLNPHGVQAWFNELEQRAAGIDDYFAFQGVAYSGTPVDMGAQGNREQSVEGNFKGLVRDGLKSNSVIWSCERLRVNVFNQPRFMWQELNDRRPGALVGGMQTRLDVLDHPWTGAETSDLLARVLLYADFGGNAYIVYRPATAFGPAALRVLRPDWVTLVLGANGDPAADPNDVDTEVVAYLYWPGGKRLDGTGSDPEVFLPDEVCHFAPMPDPDAHYRGMSWLNPVITELMADQAATAHKLQFFRNGATGGAVVLVDKDMDEDAFNRMMRKMNAQTRGLENAYKTWYVTGGMDVKMLTADLKQLDFKVTQGAGETRIAAAAGTPPILVGLSEGLNAGQYNIYGQAKRSFVDGTIRPLWANLCGSLGASIISPPAAKRLWYDDRDIPYLREDQRDQAEIFLKVMSAIETGVRAGFEPDAVVKAAASFDVMLLLGNHTGLFSVQLQPPGNGTMQGAPPVEETVKAALTVMDTASKKAVQATPPGDNGAQPPTAPPAKKVNGRPPALAGARG